METVGVRDLKAHLSRHLKRVRGGARLLVTDRGRTIAMIGPSMRPSSGGGVTENFDSLARRGGRLS